MPTFSRRAQSSEHRRQTVRSSVIVGLQKHFTAKVLSPPLTFYFHLNEF